jgi:protein SCO1
MQIVILIITFLLTSVTIFTPNSLFALEDPEKSLFETGIVSKLGAQIDSNLTFTNSDGTKITTQQLFSEGKPIILAPVYYDCPRLCGLVLSGLVKMLNEINLKLGKEYKVLSVSMDAEETPALAAKRSIEYLKQLKADEISPDSWRFLVGEPAPVNSIMSSVGFGFKKDGEEFAHSAALFILTPEGKVSQYFTGIDFSAWDVRLALIDASQGGIGSSLDHILLYCFRFDPTAGKYTLAVLNVLKVVGALTLLAMGFLFYYATRRRVS